MKVLRSIRFKYFLCLLAISVLPVLFLFFYISQNNRKFYNSQVETASASEVLRITTRINENYQDIRNLISSLIFSTYDDINCITSICEQEAEGKSITESQRLQNYRMFKYVCGNLLENASNADGVYLFCENGHVYSYMKNLYYGIERHYQEDSWYQELKENSTVEFAGMAPLDRNVYGQGDSCFLAARKFQNIRGDATAILAVVCSDAFFEDISRGENLPWGSSLIIDGKGTLVYGEEADIFTEEQLARTYDTEEGIIHVDDDMTRAFVYGTLDINDWKVVSAVSFMSFYENYMQNSQILYVLIFVDLVFVMVIVFWMERHSIRPIVRLSKVMETTAESGLVFHNEYKGRRDEIGTLYSYYDKLISQINRLIREKYQNEIKILKSRLRNLTSQINAHFIFNTLENISCLAQIEGNKQIVTMSKSLGDMLRYSMDFEGDLIRLEKEISHIQQYLNIQEVRFGNEISLVLDLEKDTCRRKVMKFMLQPIVENAIEHGMAGKDFPWIITIRTRLQNGDLYIDVEDNGIGMDKQTLERVRRRIYEPQDVEEELRCFNIGLVNIHERIQLIFSDSYGLEIESRPNEGTRVTLHIPWI